jgi:hypothetical protein
VQAGLQRECRQRPSRDQEQQDDGVRADHIEKAGDRQRIRVLLRPAVQEIRAASIFNLELLLLHRKSTDERRALIRAAMEDRASGALHAGPGTKDCKDTRAEAGALIAVTAALSSVMAEATSASGK